jgi:hypothetical protein
MPLEVAPVVRVRNNQREGNFRKGHEDEFFKQAGRAVINQIIGFEMLLVAELCRISDIGRE